MGAIQSWRDDASCRQLDKNTFYPSNKETKKIRAAKAICRSCTVLVDCLMFSINHNIPDGIFGGATEDERTLMRALLPSVTSSDVVVDTVYQESVSQIHIDIHTSDTPTIEPLPGESVPVFVLNL